MRLTFTIQRYNPETDTKPHPEEYRLEVNRGMTVLEGLIRIKNDQDGGALARSPACSLSEEAGDGLSSHGVMSRTFPQKEDMSTTRSLITGRLFRGATCTPPCRSSSLRTEVRQASFSVQSASKTWFS